jgi:uncharacterized protein (TIGR02270 family)
VTASPVILDVLSQHVDELAGLWNTRQTFIAAGHIGLAELARMDERIAAHEDGAVVGGEAAIEILRNRMMVPDAGCAFALTAVALNLRHGAAFDDVVSMVPPDTSCARHVALALGWVPHLCLVDVVRDLLASSLASRRRWGLAACRLHRIDGRQALANGLCDPDAGVRGEALRTAGEIGQLELASSTAAETDDDPHCRFWAARSAVLLGNRNTALAAVTTAALAPGEHRTTAFPLAMQAMTSRAAHAVLQRLARMTGALRWLIQGSGIAGDPSYVPWLIGHMADERTARLAAEAFALITGADLVRLDLERPRPESFEGGPNDDPTDPNVDLDADEGLPWPNPGRVQSWWDTNSARFQPGQRYFMGAPVTRAHCIDVLTNGYQRQRILAAQYLCLLEPGTPLFNTSAPAWRQQRLLAGMQ